MADLFKYRIILSDAFFDTLICASKFRYLYWSFWLDDGNESIGIDNLNYLLLFVVGL